MPDELMGRWVVDPKGNVVADELEEQIQEIVRDHLTRIGDRENGWTTLYRNPSDGSYWELTFPESQLQGGGPSKLTRIAADHIRKLYPDLQDC
jgi:hypothetical protein